MGPKKRKDDISLTKIILGICLIAVIAFGVHRAAHGSRAMSAAQTAAPRTGAEEGVQADNLDRPAASAPHRKDPQ